MNEQFNKKKYYPVSMTGVTEFFILVNFIPLNAII